MAPERAPAFQFYPKEFLADGNVGGMSLQERGAYITLLCFCWNDGSIPTDPARLATMCSTTAKAFAACWPAVRACFREQNGRFIHPRLERERAKQDEHRERRSDRGVRGAEGRWKKHEPSMPQASSKHASSIDQALLGDGSASASPISISKQIEPSAFEVFWDAYPRKVGKPKAESAFRKVSRSGPVLEAMLVAIVTQKRSAQWTRDGGEFIPHPATWLNQRRWEDELPKAAQTLSYQPEAHEAYDRWPEECRRLHDGECGNYQTHQIRLMRDARPS